uniref:Uncharacterized protein n=1 Tax=Rhizophora mucronata TaxID=61149 RepID=A0A2P2PYV3_RHIMU
MLASPIPSHLRCPIRGHLLELNNIIFKLHQRLHCRQVSELLE